MLHRNATINENSLNKEFSLMAKISFKDAV